MDGVLVDFVGGLHRALGVSFDPKNYPYLAGKYDMFEDLCSRTGGRVSMDNLYRACDSAEFWSGLEWDPMGKEIRTAILVELGSWKDVVICTSPMATPDAWKGKVEWLKKNVPEIRNISITTAPKHLYAKPGHMLIDDKDSNVVRFREHGGAAFLIPQSWNYARERYGTDYIPDLREFLGRQLRKEEFASNPVKHILKAIGFQA